MKDSLTKKKKKLSDGKHFRIRKGSIYIKAVKGKKKKYCSQLMPNRTL